jgi:Cu2+-exporting ATPase
MPASVAEGNEVFAGTINITAPLVIKTINANNNSLLSEIISLMENAEQGQAKYVRLADKIASFYTPVVHALGLLTFFGWWLFMGADWQLSLLNSVTVLIITCPCALGLAVPVVQVLASGRLFKQGILLKSGDALEKLAKVDYIVFDKTGTLTLGTPELQNVSACPGYLLQLAASMAAKSKHPLSIALTREYHGDLLDLKVEEIAGYGIEAKAEGKITRLGRRSWCGDETSEASDKLELWLSAGEEKFCFLFEDQLREDSVAVINQLQKYGFDMTILSGDRMLVVEKIAEELNIRSYQAELSPVDKCNIIKKNDHNVMMVGDGLNDAPALANAYVSISPSSAINITQNTADIVFQGKKLAAIIESIEVAKKSSMLVKQNFALAFIYNIFAIPLAMSGNVTPLIAAVAMSGSSIIVIVNALRLNWRKKK